MQEINLLQNKLKDTTQVWEKRGRLFAIGLIAALILLLAIAVSLFLLERQTIKRFETLRAQNIEEQNNLNRKQSELSSAKSFQAQLHNLNYLTANHIYWTNFFDELSEFTFAKAQYLSIDGDLTGKVHLEGVVGSYSDLGKLMLGLNTSEKFTEVKLLSVSPSSSEQAGYLFSVDLEVKKDFFLKQ